MRADKGYKLNRQSIIMRATLLLIAICIVAFIYTSSLSEEQLSAFTDRFGFSGNNLLSHPEVLVTSIFIHSGIAHLLANIFVLFFFAEALESELGSLKTLGVFFGGAFLGSIASLLIYPINAVSIGASGGVFALVGAGMLIKPFDISFYPMIMPLGLLGVIYAVYTAIGFAASVAGTASAAESNISYIAHFAGLGTGMFVGFQREGWEKGLRLVLVMFIIMLLLPYIWANLGRFIPLPN